jgi:hypothetical protein
MWRDLLISLGVALGKAALQWAIELDRQNVIISQLQAWLAEFEQKANNEEE